MLKTEKWTKMEKRGFVPTAAIFNTFFYRSEERRVGKE